MLKNVAIPLMLTASQAEGQADTPGTADYWAKILKERAESGRGIKAILNDSEGLELPELSADSEVCQGTKATTATTVSTALKTADTGFVTATTNLETAKKAVTTAKTAITTAKATTGAWGKLIKAHADAEAKVVTALATKAVKDARDEVAKAALDVDTKSRALTKALTATTSTKTLLLLLKGEGELAEILATATTAHANALTEATQVQKDLYCQLGDLPRSATNRDVTDKANAGGDAVSGFTGDWWKGYDSAATKAPPTCVVGKITYYSAKGASPGLPTETATTKWNLRLAQTEAITEFSTTAKYKKTALTGVVAADAAGSDQRQLIGWAAWNLGNWRSKQWQEAQLEREVKFWTGVEASRTAAEEEAKGQATGSKNAAGAAIDDWTCGSGTAAGQDILSAHFCRTGAKQRMAAALAERDGKSGLQKHIPATRASVKANDDASSNKTPQGAWTYWGTAKLADLNKWRAINSQDDGYSAVGGLGANSGVHGWWVKARLTTAATKAWWAKWAPKLAAGTSAATLGINNDAAKLDDVADVISAEVTGTSGKQCDLATPSALVWTQPGITAGGPPNYDKTRINGGGSKVADYAACKTLCLSQNQLNVRQVPGLSYSAQPSGTQVAKTSFGMTRANRQYSLAATNEKYWCTAYSFQVTATICSLVTADALTTATHGFPTQSSGSATNTNACQKVTNIAAYITLAKALQTAWFEMMNPQAMPTTEVTTASDQYTKKSVNSVDFDVAATWKLFNDSIAAQEVLEEAWLQAFYEHAVWGVIQTQLGNAKTGGSTAEAFPQNPDKKSSSKTDSSESALLSEELSLAKAALTKLVTTDKTVSTAKQGYMQVYDDVQFKAGGGSPSASAPGLVQRRAAIDARQAEIDWLGFRIQGAKARVAALAKDAAADKILSTAKSTAQTNLDSYKKGTTGEGKLTAAAFTAYDAWLKSAAALEAKRVLYKAALDGYKIGAVVTKVETLETAVDTAKKALDAYVTASVSKKDTGLTALQTKAEADLLLKQAAYDKAAQACRSAAFADYQKALAAALKKRGEDLDAIKKLIAKNKADEPAAGAVGSRCEKALSNGTFRPARRTDGKAGQVCNSTDAAAMCCAAAKVPLKGGADGGTKVGFRIVETCQLAATKTFSYQPPREPLATGMPAPIAAASVACIQGAKTLAAAATAAATALYMLA